VIFVRATFPDLAAAGLVKSSKCTANDRISKDEGGTDILVFRTGLLPVFDDVL
jgi:hypothetical protein